MGKWGNGEMRNAEMRNAEPLSHFEFPRFPLRSVRLSAAALNRNALIRQHFILKRVHTGGRFVDLASERDRALQDGLQLLFVLYPGGRVLVLHYQMSICHVELQ